MTDLAGRRVRVPTWWAEGKLGIFVRWGLFSVPGFAPRGEDLADLQTNREPDPFARSPYAEWYQSSLRFPTSPVSAFHRETYGDGTYGDFVDPFVDSLESWDPDRWAELFASTGATHVVFVAKHCDGFCLWPTSVRNPNRSGWHIERDVVGEMAAAVRARGLRFGLYYSVGLDWTFDATPIGTFGDMFASKGGNLLLNVGPRGDGEIPAEQLRRLGWLAERAATHQAGVRGTRPWVRAQGRSVEGHDVRFSAHDETVWAHFWLADDAAPRPSTITLAFRATPATTVTDAAGVELAFTVNESSLTIDVPIIADESVCTIGVHHAMAASDLLSRSDRSNGHGMR